MTSAIPDDSSVHAECTPTKEGRHVLTVLLSHPKDELASSERERLIAQLRQVLTLERIGDIVSHAWEELPGWAERTSWRITVEVEAIRNRARHYVASDDPEGQVPSVIQDYARKVFAHFTW